MPQDLENVVSACYSSDQEEWQIINLTQLVLDITPADGADNTLQVSTDDPSSLQNTAAELEVDAQNAVTNNQNPQNAGPGEVLLPVGATVTAEAADLPLTVAVDTYFSGQSFEATSWTSFVVSNIPGEHLDSYTQDIADCVSSSYQLWEDLSQQPPPSVASLISDTLQVSSSCNELREKVKDYLESRNQQENLAVEEQNADAHANEADWESEYSQDEPAHDEIHSDL